MRGRVGYGILAAHDAGKRDRGDVRHAKRDIQIAKADVAVDAQNALPLACKARGNGGAQRAFAGAALAGNDRYNLRHAAIPSANPIVEIIIYESLRKFNKKTACKQKKLVRRAANTMHTKTKIFIVACIGFLLISAEKYGMIQAGMRRARRSATKNIFHQSFGY